MAMTNEEMYLLLRDQKRAHDELKTRVDVLEWFIKERYPQYFAGEIGTVVDPDLNPIPITFDKPQEENRDTWKDRNNVIQR